MKSTFSGIVAGVARYRVIAAYEPVLFTERVPRPQAVLSFLILAAVFSLLCPPLLSGAQALVAKPSVAWSAAFTVIGDPPVAAPTVAENVVVVAAGELEAYDIDNGSLLWHHAFQQYVPKSIVADNGRILVAEAAVYALSARDGKTLWSQPIDGNAALCAPAVLHSVYYVGTSTHKIYAFDSASGKLLWRRDLEPNAKYASAVTGIAAQDGALVLGLQKWRAKNGLESSGVLYKLEPRTGKIIWRIEDYHPGKPRIFSSAPSLTNRLVVLSDYASNSILAFALDSGAKRWSFHGEPGFAGFSEPPQIDATTLYAASPDMYVYAINLQNGTLRWRSKMTGSNLALGFCGDRLLVSYQQLALLEKETGQVLIRDFQPEHDASMSSRITTGRNAAFIAGPRAIYKITCP